VTSGCLLISASFARKLAKASSSSTAKTAVSWVFCVFLTIVCAFFRLFDYGFDHD